MRNFWSHCLVCKDYDSNQLVELNFVLWKPIQSLRSFKCIKLILATEKREKLRKNYSKVRLLFECRMVFRDANTNFLLSLEKEQFKANSHGHKAFAFHVLEDWSIGQQSTGLKVGNVSSIMCVFSSIYLKEAEREPHVSYYKLTLLLLSKRVWCPQPGVRQGSYLLRHELRYLEKSQSGAIKKSMNNVPATTALWRAPQDIVFACMFSKLGASRSLGSVWSGFP